MREISPKILIDGEEVDYLDGKYELGGSLTSAVLTFKLPLAYGAGKKLWNKEVLLYLNEFDSTPLFRGWIKRTNPDFNEITIRAEDALVYMLKGGEDTLAIVRLTDTDNVDGLSAGAAIAALIKRAKLDSKLKTDIIGNTTPVVGSTHAPLRGNVKIMDAIKGFLGRAVDTSGTLPRPNIGRIIDDGSNSQFIIELEDDITSDTAVIKHVYTEEDNIINLNIINRKIPTVITVKGHGGVSSTFTHDSAIDALDRNYFEVTNNNLMSPAACKEFGARVFETNLLLQYEYAITTLEGAYLSENDIIMIETDDSEFSGKYRVIGKTVSFSPSSYSIGLSINKRPPVLADYIATLDN